MNVCAFVLTFVSDHWQGTINLDTYVPPDERCSPKKLSEFIANAIQATAHFLLPEAKSLPRDSSSFESFGDIRDLYSNNRRQAMRGTWVTKEVKKFLPAQLFKDVTHVIEEVDIKIPLPQIIRGDIISHNNNNMPLPLIEYALLCA